ncbi:hypothetical protein GFS24_03200 [Chitinophaga sp. SYP-B3965]|uniref:hypothetical protein n=1 Tax=Chitinophaga sp. SYP-B3965 TaxID=2663120 RepID=UPI001299BC90|nr:hypothetical protein [Chitinophaga sp. SYP-B3965]MRG44101.1 hypothetical protein [Chitinophaga sp. SYP-B3965]
MGKQVSIVKYTGKVDNMVGYYHKGKLYFRSMPEQVNRSEATKLAAIDFGTASKSGKLVRDALKQELSIRHDSDLTNRLNAAMMKVLYAGNQERGNRSILRKHVSMLVGLKLNNATELSKLLPFTPKVVQDGNSLRIAIPALSSEDILHTKNTTHIEIKAITAGLNFNEGNRQDAVSDKVMIDFRQPAVATELILPFKAGDDETVVVLQVKAFKEEQGKLCALGNRKYFAADIIDIIPSLEEVPERKEYSTMPEHKAHQMAHSYFAVPQLE